MKKSAIAILLLMATVKLSAQSFDEGSKMLNLGIGIGTPFFGSGFSSSLPINPTIAWDNAVSDNISLGGCVSYASSKFTGYDLKYSALYIGGRGAYHFTVSNKKLDPYLGLGAGYVIVSASDKSGVVAGASSSIGYSVMGGCRYFFGNKIGVYGELGYTSLSYLNAGLTFKL